MTSTMPYPLRSPPFGSETPHAHLRSTPISPATRRSEAHDRARTLARPTAPCWCLPESALRKCVALVAATYPPRHGNTPSLPVFW